MLVLAGLIERFGFAAMTDRPLRGGEVMAITHAERIVRAVAARKSAESVLVWEMENAADGALWNRLYEAWPIDSSLRSE